MSTSVSKQSLDVLLFKRLTRLYIIALSAVALSIIVSHIIIDNDIVNQKEDSNLINLSGRQRMLSQKLVKEVLQLQNAKSTHNINIRISALDKTLDLWSSSHHTLKKQNNSTAINQLFYQIDPYFDAILVASHQIIHTKKKKDSPENLYRTKQLVAIVNKNEGHFLQLMDKIVNEYEEEATDKLMNLRFLELIIFLITILILIVELLFVYKPTATYVKSVISKLLEAEKKAVKMAYDADMLCESKEESVKELKALNYAMDQTLLFCRVTPEGVLTQMGDNFRKLLKVNSFDNHLRFANLLTTFPKERIFIDYILSDSGKSGWRGELEVTTEKGSLWLDTTIIPVPLKSNKTELLIVCLNITERKIAQYEVERLNKERFYNEMNHQKIVSSKIVENQENEQNRIAKEIHDGIGQMLTGLKFSLESIDLDDKEKTEEKIIYLKKLAGDIIKGVRTATFNLMPPEVKDHGIASSLLRMTQELSKLTGKNIVFLNKTDFNQRLDSLVEINVYRITQEAINNAIKYANSSHIVVMISHRDELLSITIDDNGDGFDTKEVENFKSSESGMGMEFMKERIKYINGRLFLNSEKGEGTHITLNVPIK